MNHYHIGDRGIVCASTECPTEGRYARPDYQKKCMICGLEKWSREEFPFFDDACVPCGSAACAKGYHSVDFDCIGWGVITTFWCMRCDWASQDAAKGFGLLGAVQVPPKKEEAP